MYAQARRSGAAVQAVRLLQSQLLGVQAHAMHPQLLEVSLSFYTATTQWLVRLVQGTQEEPLPLPDTVRRSVGVAEGLPSFCSCHYYRYLQK